MTREEIRGKLKIGGGWIGAARNWLLWHKDKNGTLTWDSDDPVPMTVKEIEAISLEVASAAIQESDRVTGQRRKLIDILIKLTPLVGVYMGAQGLVNFGHDSVGVPTALIEGVADGIRDLKILIYGKNDPEIGA